MSRWPALPPGWLFPAMIGGVVLVAVVGAAGADVRPAAAPWFDPEGIRGSLVVVGGGRLPDAVADQFVKWAGGEQARLVVIPTAAEGADRGDEAADLNLWQRRGVAEVVRLHTRDRRKADDPEFVKPLTTATGVWLGGGDQSRLAAAYRGTAVEQALQAVLERGGVVGGTSAGAAVMSRVMIAGGQATARVADGFDLLPGVVIDQHFLKRQRQARLAGVVDARPGIVGLGIDEGTALIVQGRQLRVVGDSSVTVYLAAGSDRPARTLELKAGARSDLTMLRRAALARAGESFPPKTPRPCAVPQGALVIVGGGGMPLEITRKFIDLAGGPDSLILVLPTAMPPQPAGRTGAETIFLRAGAKNVKVMRAYRKADVEAPENLELLRQAKGVWFGGGRQWRFVDAYAGTEAEPLFHEVLHRGGVIGGSSAGASIQAEYMVRGSPLGNTEMMCEGYERGLGFLPGAAVDQHFSQRNRFGDLASVVRAYPQILGIGIDEATAIVVRGQVAEVMGRNTVTFLDGRADPTANAPKPERLSAGARYDLQARQVQQKPE